MPRPDYGYDAPYALLMFAIASGVTGIGALIFLSQHLGRGALLMGFYFLFFLGNAGSFYYTTRRGCGRGAVLNAVARRLNSGRVTGIDLWSKTDQSGNAREVTLRNAALAALEGVSERVQIETGDMRSLPFPDASFDLVVSSLAIHNIRSQDDRRKAVAEGFRVLKPGGRMVIVDIRATRLYEEALRTLGAENVQRRRLGWRFWWGNPVAASSLVTCCRAVT